MYSSIVTAPKQKLCFYPCLQQCLLHTEVRAVFENIYQMLLSHCLQSFHGFLCFSSLCVSLDSFCNKLRDKNSNAINSCLFCNFFEVLELLVDEWDTAPEREASNKVCVKIQRKEGRLEFPPQVKFVKVTQSCLTLCDPINYTVYGILQARILGQIAIPFSRGSSQPRKRTQVSHIAGGFFTS